MTENLGRCDKKQYEHCGPHPQYADVGQRLPPFACVNWKPEDEGMAENEAPERIRLIRDNNGLFRSGWYYLDAAVGPHHSAIHYVRADLAAPAGNELEVAKAIVNKRAAASTDAYRADLILVDDIARAIRDAVCQARRETWKAAIEIAKSHIGHSDWSVHTVSSKRISCRTAVIEELETAALRAEGKGDKDVRTK